jgi:uncharacterized protein (DUF885 family)
MTMKFTRKAGMYALVVGMATMAWVAVPQAADQATQASQTAPATVSQDEVPTDLRPLLSPALSEMRLVTQRYTQDRNTLNGNYLPGGGRQGGGGRGGRGGGQAAAPAPPTQSFTTSLSPNRIARLKRFDIDWQSALAGVNAAALSPAAQADLKALKATIETNLKQLDVDAGAIAAVMPLVPFAPDVIAVIEHRMRMGDMDAQASAAAVDRITKSVGRVRQSLQAGLAAGPVAKDAMRVTPTMARNGADAVDAIRASFTEWFNHYNTFDPLFTWWVPMPMAHLEKALTEYAVFLREPVAAANHDATNAPIGNATIAPAPAPAMSSVPNLQEIIALPSDEMAPVVQRFRGTGGGGGRGGAPATRPVTYYERWLAALKTLDFDRLSRNAQVSYLYVKKQAELEIARAAFKPETDAPRKTDDSGITGAARGRAGLIFDLGNEMIPYTPEELIRLGEREFAWTVAEMEKAATEMGLGTDWSAAVERVKNMYVEPGRQPEYVRDLLFEAVTYLRNNDLITVPAVASESFRMVMLSPERQLTAPFFLGGSQILVAFPTNTQEYDTRMQVLRGNNKFFSNAVAHHEMIPGHNLVGFMGSRFNGYRAGLGGTPFLGEGWPLYWETILYDKGFHDSPEKKVGALFWRMHRAARIIFSLKFHMGQWSPQEAIDFLVNEVGHERDNATAEVRRSFGGQYGPLYQMAYLVGGLQIRGMKREIVDSGMRTEKDFHDEIMRQGSMPVAFLRLAVSKMPLTRDMVVDWKFYGELK